MTDPQPPAGYEAPPVLHASEGKHYFLEPQPRYTGAVPQFMVMCHEPSKGKRILAERCFLDDAMTIVDALRLLHGIANWSATA
jgi:hypothetical protein